MIVDAIRNLIKTCPFLDEFRNGIGIDYLGDDVTCYMIEPVPCNPILKNYVNGDSKRQYLFVFASRESYGSDVLQNIDNINFYEKFANWLETVLTDDKVLDLGEDKEVLKLKAITTGYAFETDIDKAKYQIQCQLTYYQNKL